MTMRRRLCLQTWTLPRWVVHGLLRDAQVLQPAYGFPISVSTCMWQDFSQMAAARAKGLCTWRHSVVNPPQASPDVADTARPWALHARRWRRGAHRSPPTPRSAGTSTLWWTRRGADYDGVRVCAHLPCTRFYPCSCNHQLHPSNHAWMRSRRTAKILFHSSPKQIGLANSLELAGEAHDLCTVIDMGRSKPCLR